MEINGNKKMNIRIEEIMNEIESEIISVVTTNKKPKKKESRKIYETQVFEFFILDCYSIFLLL